MPEKFTFPTIQQAISLQSAESMQEIKVSLRGWFNKSSFKLSQNVAWSFKYSKSDKIFRRYIHCKYCMAKLILIKQSEGKDNKLNTFKLVRFNLHHDHRFIDKVKQQGKLKTFPQNYSYSEVNRDSFDKQRKERRQKSRKKRVEINKYKKLELYYRLNLELKENEKDLINVKELAAKSIGLTTQRFMCFLNSGTRGVIEVTGIKKLLKNAGFQKYDIEIDSNNTLLYNKAIMADSDQQQPINSQEQQREESKTKEKKSNSALIIQQSKQFFKQIMIFINYSPKAKLNLQQTNGFVNIYHFEDKIISKKFMKNMKWNVLLLYSHDVLFQPNQLYALIMIENDNFNIKQIKKSLEITFRLLNPLKKINFNCALHQENIFIMGALDLIIEEIPAKNQQFHDIKQSSNLFCDISYFLSPKLSTQILNKCEFIPKIFRKKLIEKICTLQQKQIDEEYQKIISQLEKASKIKEYKAKTQEYIAQLKQFYQNFHKIFLAKFPNPQFTGLTFLQNKIQNYDFETSINGYFQQKLEKFCKGNKYFFEFIIMIFDIFKIPKGSFIYEKHSGYTRQATKLETNYANFFTMPEYQIVDQIKKLYNKYAFKGKYYKPKSKDQLNINADFFEQFSALLYQSAFQLKEIFMKVCEQIRIILIREIQKSFTLQIQTKTVEQLKKQGTIKIKENSKHPLNVKIINQNKFWPLEKQKRISSLQKNKKKTRQLQKPLEIIELQWKQESKNEKLLKKNRLIQDFQKETKKVWQCECNYSKFTHLPCCHQIRSCFTFFTSVQDQIDDFWLFDPNKLQGLGQNQNKNDVLTDDEEAHEQNQDKEAQQNSQSD